MAATWSSESRLVGAAPALAALDTCASLALPAAGELAGPRFKDRGEHTHPSTDTHPQEHCVTLVYTCWWIRALDESFAPWAKSLSFPNVLTLSTLISWILIQRSKW